MGILSPYPSASSAYGGEVGGCLSSRSGAGDGETVEGAQDGRAHLAGSPTIASSGLD